MSTYGLPPDSDPVRPDRAELARDVRRVADRLRGAVARKLDAPLGTHATVERAAHEALTDLADLAAGTEARDAAAPPVWRAVPDAGAGALGDQVAVLGADLLTAISGVPDEVAVWTPAGPESLGSGLARLAARLRELRMAL